MPSTSQSLQSSHNLELSSHAVVSPAAENYSGHIQPVDDDNHHTLDDFQYLDPAEDEPTSNDSPLLWHTTSPPPPSPPPLETDYTPPPPIESNIEEIRVTDQFIQMLQNATLDGPGCVEQLPSDLVARINNPPDEPLVLDDKDEQMSIKIFLAVSNASENTYNRVWESVRKRYPDSGMLTFHKVKQLIADLSGVTPVKRDMCINSCLGYTGPFRDLELQTLWRDKKNAQNLHYRWEYTHKVLQEFDKEGKRVSPYRDLFGGDAYLNAYEAGRVSDKDMVLVLSIDGAQLYRNKASDCWIYIWVIYDYSPELRYKKKHVLPGGFIPGPNKPKHLDSFIFSALYHVSALQWEGLRIWDAHLMNNLVINPFFALATADGPGMASLSGCVGHHGKVHCRFYCPLRGRRKQGASIYYPARFLPNQYTVSGCVHPDIQISNLLRNFTPDKCISRYNQNLDIMRQSQHKTDYERNRLETGISKPSIFSGLDQSHSIPVPTCFPGDIMHLPCLNIPDLFFSLWRGTLDCDKSDSKDSWWWAVLKDDVWKEHGLEVAKCTPYIPGSFDRPPRNPAEKINSGYKAWEYLLYFFGLGPCLFHGVLPDTIWEHYCKLVRAFRLMMQEEILVEEIQEASRLFTEFSDEFETIYVQRHPGRIHFVRPSIHSISHIPPEVLRLGPFIIFAQWVIERTIGNLGEEIKQHSSPYTNLQQRGVRRCQVNALKALVPDLEPSEASLPRGALDIGDDFMFLRARDRTARAFTEREYDAWKAYWTSNLGGEDTDLLVSSPKVYRWAKLRLPNGQTARCRWKEEPKQLLHIRMSRHVKFNLNGKVRIGEVHFYFQDIMKGKTQYCAMVSLFDIDVRMTDAKDILSVVMMAPDPRYKHAVQDGTEVDRWFMMEKPGLKILSLQGYKEAADNEIEPEE
ncbi:hypothetical protein PQX77_021077 [Marasmius sp. AFHP31]|nr:hypothetical protein PQX77_021077 [Marasmius sp. AFHP31]